MTDLVSGALGQNEFFEDFFQSSPAVMLLIEPETGRIVDANRRACEFYGYSLDELTCMDIAGISDQPEEYRKGAMAEVAANGSSEPFLAVHRLSDGALRNVNVFRGRIRQGNRTLVHSIVHDVTRCLSPEEEQHRNQRLELALQATGKGIWDWNMETDVVYVSPCYLVNLGYDSGDLPSGYGIWERLIHPEDLSWMIPHLKAHSGSDENLEMEFRIREKKGGWRWVLGRGKVRDREPDHPRRIGGTRLDIHRGKRIEKALQRHQNFLEDLVENLPLGFFTKDVETGKYLLSNRQYKRLLGKDADGIAGARESDFFEEETGLKIEAMDRQVLETRKPAILEDIRFSSNSRGIRILQIIKALVLNESGEPLYIIGIVEDQTEQKRTMESLSRSGQELSVCNRILSIFLSAGENEVYDGVVEALLDIFNCEFGYLGYIDEKGNLVCPTMTKHIWQECQMPGKDIVFHHETWGGLWGESLREEKTLMRNEELKTPPGHVPCATPWWSQSSTRGSSLASSPWPTGHKDSGRGKRSSWR